MSKAKTVPIVSLQGLSALRRSVTRGWECGAGGWPVSGASENGLFIAGSEVDISYL